LCSEAYAYREYTTDMVPTGVADVINCYGGNMDTGGLFDGDYFYFAYQSGPPLGSTSRQDGWRLGKYSAVDWTPLVNPSSHFFPVNCDEDPGDPMIALVNGLIDVSSKMKLGDPAKDGTHHRFFTTDLEYTNVELFLQPSQPPPHQVPPHHNLTSMIQTSSGVINFVAGQTLSGPMIVMQFDKNWNYLGPAPSNPLILKVSAGAPEGLAVRMGRFYVSYLDVSGDCPEGASCQMNVRLAEFDSNWKRLNDIAVTNYVLADHQMPGRPSLAVHNNLIYVCYDQIDTTTTGDPKVLLNTQVYVKVYETR
jgi:hypothetical protein